jgi:large subunit ribosomal protein L30
MARAKAQKAKPKAAKAKPKAAKTKAKAPKAKASAQKAKPKAQKARKAAPKARKAEPKSKAAPKAQEVEPTAQPEAIAASRAGTLRVTLTKSPVGRLRRHQACVIGLGLRRIGQTVEVEDSAAVRGMISRVRYMVRVEEES